MSGVSNCKVTIQIHHILKCKTWLAITDWVQLIRTRLIQSST